MKKRLLSSKEIEILNETLPDWTLHEDKLEKKFQFKDFIEAFGFITKVAIISESLGHHPEWCNIYSTVNIKLTTHDLSGISTFDITLAKEINKLY